MNLFRAVHLGTFACCAALTAIALYMQYVLWLDPCPLCVVQRIAVIAVGLASLGAALHNPAGGARKAYCYLVSACAVFGAAIAARHVYLQNLPEDKIPECLPGIGFIFENNSLIDALGIVFEGTGECAETVWTAMGISIPGWTLIAFCVFAAAQLFLTRKLRPRLQSH